MRQALSNLRPWELILLFVISLFLSLKISVRAQPAGFTDQVYLDGWDKVVGFTWDANGRMYVWEYAGKVWIVDNGVKQSTPLLDISDEVGGWRDFGLLGFALDPNFISNGYFYLLYVVDRHHLLNYGTPDYDPNVDEYYAATIGRVTRYQADPATNFTTVVPGSRQVLVGTGPGDGPPILHESHGVGHLVFGEDGTLMVSIGDGASYSSRDEGSAAETYWSQALADGIITPAQNIGAYRCQTLDNYSGKMLRLDPQTGEGVPSNPYYDPADPASPASRIWARGLRNPYRFALVPESGSHDPADGNPGTFLIGDVGWGTREELSLMNAPGMNFGWPKYEGMTHQPGYNNGTYAPPTHDLPVADWRTGSPRAYVDGTIYNIGSAQVPGPSFLGNASTGGTWYQGDDFPAEWKNTYFHADYGGGWIRNFVFDQNMRLTEVRDFISNAGACVFVGTHPTQGNLYYVRYPNQIRRVTFTGVTNHTPVVFAQADQTYGNSPLTVSFSSQNTFDQDGDPLTFLWNFGDGTTSTDPNPTHTFTGTGANGWEVVLTVMDDEGLTASTTLNIAVNNQPPQITGTSVDGVNGFDPHLITNLPLTATVSDPDNNAGQLSYHWEVLLYHNQHNHPVTEVFDPTGSAFLSPVECYLASYWYRIKLTVTDPSGLSDHYEKDIFPNCDGAAQSITFPAISDKVVTDAPFILGATASSGLPVSYYKIEGPVVVTGNQVVLTGVPGKVTIVATQPGNGTYRSAPNVERSFWVNVGSGGGCVGTGLISREVWTGVGGTAVSQIPLNTTPDIEDQLTIFEIPINTMDNFGTRVRGYLCPPVSGQYKFWIASDDNSELWLSTDANPANKQLIANVPGWTGSRQWGKYTQQQSAAINLVAGQLYYIEALQKEGGGADNLAVGWELPNGVQERPIPGLRLLPFGSAAPTASFTANPSSGTAPLSVDFDASASTDYDGSIVSYSWDFGDGNNGTGTTPTHTYTLEGDYTATLTVTDNNGNSNSATLLISVTGSGPQDQTISFPAIGNKLTTDPPFVVTATASSGLPVSLEVVSGPATLSGNTLILDGNPGTVTIRATQPGDANWNPAPPVEQSFDVTEPGGGGGVDLELTMSASPNFLSVYNNIAFTATVTNNGTQTATGVQVHFPKPAGVVFVGGNEFTASQGTYNLFTDLEWSVGTLTPGASASLTVNWFVLQSSPLTGWAEVSACNQPDADSTPGNGTCCTANEDDEAALTVTEPGAGPQDQTISFPAIPDKLTTDGPFSLVAAATSGLPVSFELLSGPATLSGNTVTLDGVVGTVTIRATQPGNADWNPAPPVERSFQVVEPGKQNQTIDFPAIATKQTTDAPFDLGATATSGLPVSYEVVSGPAALSGNTVTLDGVVGTVTIRATQPGDADWNPAAPVERSFAVVEPGTSLGVDLELSMSASPATVTQWGNIAYTVTVTNAGTDPATGVQIHFPKPASVVYVGGNEFTVSKGNFALFGNEVWTVGGLAPGASETLTVNWFILQNQVLTGWAEVSACVEQDFDSTPGNGACCAAIEDDEAAFTATLPGAGPQDQTISFPAISDKLITDGPFSLVAAATSGLPVSFELLSGPATLSGNTVTLDGVVGTVTIRATQPGNADWNPAPPVERSFQVVEPGKQNQTIDFPAIATKQTTDAPFDLGATATSGLPVSYEVVSGPAALSGNTVTLDGVVGTVTIRATQPGDADWNPAPPVERSFVVVEPGMGGPDLELSLAASGSTLTIWQNITFSVSLSNNGTEAATGIAVDVPIPAGNLAYTTSSASDGSYDLFFKEWNISSLAPGQTATLDIELFVLQNSTPLPYFVEVVAASPADLDSSPGNNTTGTPEEDDEALITLQPPGNQLAIATGEVFTLFASQNGSTARLKWVSNTGYLTDEFVAEHSADGYHWDPLFTQEPESDDDSFSTYRSMDSDPEPGLNYYRIRQVRKDGLTRFSNVVLLEFNGELDAVRLFPNPAGQYVDVNLRAFAGKPVQLQLITRDGDLILREDIAEAPLEPWHLELWEVPDGFYVLWIHPEGHRTRALPLVIDKHY